MTERLVEFKKLPSGNLRIELLPEGREEVEEIQRREDIGIFHKFCDVIEFQLANGWDLIHPEEIAALISDYCPVLSDEATYDDHGEAETIGRVYWFPDYQIYDEVEKLLEDGSIVFEGVA
jgi:hypothetical protein